VASQHREDGAAELGTGGIDLVLSRRDPPGEIAGALLERLSPS
jgi:hypothetical protein